MIRLVSPTTLIYVDGAHALYQLDINLSDLKPDFYTANFNKWGYSPRPVGFLWA
jgi:isopenicillin-N epimerase